MLNPIVEHILKERYYWKEENSWEDVVNRVVNHVVKAEKEEERELWRKQFKDILMKKWFIPNSPTLMNAGKEKGGCLSACFVLPIGDSMEEIYTALKNQALTQQWGGGTGFDFSSLRSKGEKVNTTEGLASGVVSFLKLFSFSSDVVQQGGARRGANMGILRYDHPEILDFIHAKDKGDTLYNFNLSVSTDEHFWNAVKNDDVIDLIDPHSKKVKKKIKARELLDEIVKHAWDTGDPGIVFLDNMNKNNPFIPIRGIITATNPCSEEPLYPFGSCNLGSIAIYNIYKDSRDYDSRNYGSFFDNLRYTTYLAIRFLDDVVSVNKFPLEEQQDEAERMRNIGLGIMGWADYLISQGIKYDTDRHLDEIDKIMTIIQDEANHTSIKLGEEKGYYPLYYEARELDIDVPKRRNSFLFSIAPTGTISILAGVSSGIEPIFSFVYKRRVLWGEEGQKDYIDIHPLVLKYIKDNDIDVNEDEITNEWIKENLPDYFITAHDIHWEWHVKVQAKFQEYVDSSISKTINMPHDATIDDVRNAYILAHELGCKGITIYRDGSKNKQVIKSVDKKEEKEEQKGLLGVNTIDRPYRLKGETIKIPSAYGNVYITLNYYNGKPFEVFATVGKSGYDTMANTEAISRLISIALQHGVSIDEIIKQLKGIGGENIKMLDNLLLLSLPDTISKGLESLVKKDKTVEVSVDNANKCPVCGGELIYEEGCYRCPNCGWSKCS